MNKTTRNITAILLTAAMLSGLAACSKQNPKDSDPETSKPLESKITFELNEPVIHIDSDDSKPDEDAAAGGASQETNQPDNDVPSATVKPFNPANIIKIGDHTYYPDYLFENDSRFERDGERMLAELKKADKTLHDDVFIYGFGESEFKDEYRFFGKYMQDGIILQEGEMIAPFDPDSGYVWDIDVRHFRRCETDSSNLAPIEDICDKVYEAAIKEKGPVVTGTYILKADINGKLYYEFRINTFSTVTIDAKTCEIIEERYWDGIYY